MAYPERQLRGARVLRGIYRAIIPFDSFEPDKSVQATPDATAKFIEDSVVGIIDPKVKQETINRMRTGLIVDPANDDTAKIAEVWRKCEEGSVKVPQTEFDKKHAAFLRDLVCEAKESRGAIARGIIRNWVSDNVDRRAFSAQLARGLLGEDGRPCAATKDLDESDKETLRATIAAAPSAPGAEPEPGPAASPSPPATVAPTPAPSQASQK
jgi:hypothetical protein